MKNLYKKLLAGILCVSMLTACEKFVDIEPKGQLIPTSTDDFRMLLDYVQFMNFTGGLAELAADDIYFNDLTFENTLSNPFEQNTYLWKNTVYMPSDQATDWNSPYKRIYQVNIILEGLAATTSGTEAVRRALEGEALFHRAHAHYEVASLYAKSYDPATAATDLGIPLRLTTDVFVVSERPTLEVTYAQIFEDLNRAVELLPSRATVATRASKAAAYGLLARIYLDMGRYEDARDQALNALEIQSTLMDYNEIDPFGWPKFDELNEEILFFATIPNFGYSFNWSFPVKESIYDMYTADDLRKSLFFSVYTGQDGAENIDFGGNYAGSWNRFTGLAVDEMYLTTAECLARTGDLPGALTYLNDLLVTRYVTGTYTPFESNDETEVLEKILLERRKQLIGRNRRWSDLKRLSHDSRFAVTLERTVLGQTYTLPPGDPRWVFPIPQTVIDATGMEQNQR